MMQASRVLIITLCLLDAARSRATAQAIGKSESKAAEKASERPIARELVSQAVNLSNDMAVPKNRIRFVQTIATYCGEVLKALPTNTPNEDAWVKAESNTSDSAKLDRLVSTAEFARRQLKSTFENCAEDANELARIQARSSKQDSDLHDEAAGLLRVAFDLNDDEGIRIYAARARLDQAAWLLDFISSVRKTLIVAALRTLGR